MRRALRWSEVVVAVAVAALPFKAGGCGTTACITVTPAQLVNGACPGPAAALARFSDPSCPSTISNVDGAGTLDGNFCCYPVDTQNDGETIDCGDVGVGGGSFGEGVGGSSFGEGGFGGGSFSGGGFSGGGGGFGGSFGVGTGGFGGAGGG